MKPTQKFVAFFLAVLIFIGASGVVAPPKAHAQLAVVDFPDILQNTISAITNAKVLTNPIFYAISQAAIQSVVKDTVSWINSGFQGSPAYVTDIKATIQDAADQQANGFIKEFTSSSAINSPFRDTIAQSVLQNYYLSTSKDSFFLQNPYTLNQVSPNPAALAQGDLSQGGLQAFMAQAISPANNWLGAKDLAQRELDSRVAGATGQINQEAGWGSGFLSYRKCDAQGTTLTDTSSQGTISVIAADGSVTQKPLISAQSLTPTQTCLASHIETPGSVIAGQLNHTLGLGSDSLIQAKDFDEIVNALLGQLVKQVVGATGLNGLTQGSATTGGSGGYLNPSTSTSGGTTSTSAGVTVVSSFLQIVAGQESQLQQYLTSWQTISGAAIAAKAALAASTCVPNAQALIATKVQPVITQAATAIGTVPSALSALDAIRTQVTNATTQDSATQASTLQQANASYTSLLSSNTLPTVADFTLATQQSQDTGTSSPSSLLTQMNQLTAQARCGP